MIPIMKYIFFFLFYLLFFENQINFKIIYEKKNLKNGEDQWSNAFASSFSDMNAPISTTFNNNNDESRQPRNFIFLKSIF